MSTGPAGAHWPPRPADQPGRSLDHLLGRLDVLRRRVAALVAARRAVDASPDDPFLGLYLSEERIDELLHNDRIWVPPDVAAERLDEVERAADTREAADDASRLRVLAERFGLDALDVDILLAALAPDVDDRFERYYGYLNDDVTRRRVSVALALGLAGVPAASAAARRRFEPASRLVATGLLDVDDPDRPFLTRSLRVPDRVTAHLLGDDAPDSALDLLRVDVTPTHDVAHEPLARALGDPDALVYVRDRGAMAVHLAADAAAAAGIPAVAVDLAWLPSSADADRVALAAAREARLGDGALIAGPIDELADVDRAALRRLDATATRLVLFGQRPWDPAWAQRAPLIVEAPPLSPAGRERLWSSVLTGNDDSTVELAADLDVAATVGQYRLGPGQIARAAAAAVTAARIEERPVTAADVRLGARQQNAAGLERLARRIESHVSWDDLVLPPAVRAGLHQLADRARFRDRVLGDWGMRPGGGRGTGITALFAGDSGTGKTMSAEVIAGDLGIDLYVVNLATVVDKYIGETEKNLDRIFSEAADVNGILLFDEADALFGQRSEVRDSHDRYANIEVAYLLQRMESFDGVAILATNLRANIDEAFTRRLDAVVDFPMPDAALRRELWSHCLAPLPRDAGLEDELDRCAAAFELSGGNIRSIALTVGYAAAAGDRPVTVTDVVRAVGEEYRKLGRLCLEAEFGPYYPLLRP